MALSGLTIRVTYTTAKTLVALLIREDGLVWDNAQGSWIALSGFVSSDQGVPLQEGEAPLVKSYSGTVPKGKLGNHVLAIHILDYTGSPFCIGIGSVETRSGYEVSGAVLTPQQISKLENLDVPVSSRAAAAVNPRQFGVGVS